MVRFKGVFVILDRADDLIRHFNFAVDRRGNILFVDIPEVVNYQEKI